MQLEVQWPLRPNLRMTKRGQAVGKHGVECGRSLLNDGGDGTGWVNVGSPGDIWCGRVKVKEDKLAGCRAGPYGDTNDITIFRETFF